MSSIANLTSTPSVLPPVNTHPHGHKKGLLESIGDSNSGAAAKAPAGAVQNLFGSLLHSLEQIIGVHLNVAMPAAPATLATTGANPTANTAAVAPTASAATASVQSASALLQNYSTNSPKLAGSNVSVNA